MDTSFVKFFILWIICENVVLTTSMVLKGTANANNNRRQKRSPANNFSLFSFNPLSTAKESFSAVENIFSGNHGNQQHHNNYQKPIEVGNPYGNVRNTNTLLPGDFPSRNGIPKPQNDYPRPQNDYPRPQNDYSRPQNDYPRPQNDYQNKNDWPRENKNKVEKPVQDTTQKPSTKTVPERNNEVLKDTSEVPSNGEVDKQLLDYIFQQSQFNYDAAGTTVDSNTDIVTETGAFETTTEDFNRILPPAAVASLLG
ncbi:hypothetical protein PYW08_014811 [Mythimna loreyi]|uniref:Uncharacterized protein n=1 Tax=Mythimna loreyi TaxID=667449 RepID=A0ACC2R3J0_9NEOP|nr:hypothetical protein PYW08_014811 [Mythimna loreyi]